MTLCLPRIDLLVECLEGHNCPVRTRHTEECLTVIALLNSWVNGVGLMVLVCITSVHWLMPHA